LIPGWPNRDPSGHWDFRDEPLTVAVNGHLYILNWPQFGAFCNMFERIGPLFRWK